MLRHVAITGSHGVGKSTLQKCLLEQAGIRGSWEPVAELPRTYIKASGSDDYLNRRNHTPLKQFMFLPAHLEVELELDRKGEKGIFDRFYIDYLAYFEVLFAGQISGIELDLARNIARSHSQGYTVIFVPIEFPIISDGVTELDPVFQSAINSKILELLTDFNISYHTVSGSVEDRCKSVSLLLEDSGHLRR